MTDKRSLSEYTRGLREAHLIIVEEWEGLLVERQRLKLAFGFRLRSRHRTIDAACTILLIAANRIQTLIHRQDELGKS